MFNVIRIIYSIILCNKIKSYISEEDYERVVSTHTTWWLTDKQIVAYCRYLKSIGECKDWTLPQMFREVKYHNVLYKYHLFRTHTDHAYLEKKQTLKTYVRRIIGNCIW